MENLFTFDLNLPDIEYFGGTIVAENLTLREYKATALISYTSGSLISATNGLSFDQAFVTGSYTDDSLTSTLTIHDSNFFTGNDDIIYNITISDFVASLPVVTYSASAISVLSGLTLEQFGLA